MAEFRFQRLERLLDAARRRNVFRPLSIYVGIAWLLISAGDVFFPLLAVPQAYFPFFVWLLVAGVPLVAIGAWFIGPIAPPEEGATNRLGLGLELLVVLVLLSALVLALLLQQGNRPAMAVEPPEKSIAVLPFLDFSSSQDQAYFGFGLAEELLNVLAANPTLRVAARTSSFQFAEAGREFGQIAEQLGVRYVLEGSVRREGERLRVTAQLIDSSSGFHLWSESFDEGFADVFAIQDRIAGQIVAALELELLDAPAIRRTDPESYRQFLSATQAARTGSAAALAQAEEQLRAVVAVDPDYAPAWARLASVLANRASQGDIEQAPGFAQSRAAAQRAVEVGPDYAGGHLQLAWLAHRVDGDLATSFRYLQEAIDLEPRSVAALWQAANLLLQAGRLEDAIELFEHCANQSRIYPTGYFNLGIAYKYAGRFAEAEAAFDRVGALSPNYNGLAYQLGEVYLHQGRLEEAEALWAGLDAHRPLYGRALLAHARGDEAAADDAQAQLARDYGDQWPGVIADVAAYRGQRDVAFEWLERDVAKFGAGGWGELKLQRFLVPLHEDPRWSALLTRLGVSSEQLAPLKLELPAPTVRP